MRQSRIYILLLLAIIMSATGAFAQTVGTQFTVDGITYEITKQDLSAAHDNEVTIVRWKWSGQCAGECKERAQPRVLQGDEYQGG